MRGVHLFILLIALPALAALGHDIYLFYSDHGITSIVADVNKTIADKGPLSMFATLGFIWTQYHPESYKLAAQGLDQESWEVVNALLAQKAIFVSVVFAGFFYVPLLIMKTLGTWPFKE